MPAGELRERVAFARRVTSSDGAGNERAEFSTQFTAWARIQPLKGGEEVLASRLAGVQPVIIRIRSSEAAREIATTWRATDTRTGREYDITAVANMDERNGYLDLMATAGKAVG